MFHTPKGILISHLGMTGTWREKEKGEKLRTHDHVLMHLKERILVYNDPRRFGSFEYCESENLDSFVRFKHLGPEPLDEEEFNLEYLWQKSRKKEIIRFAGKVIVERTRTFNFSSAHITFCTNHEAKILTDIGFLHRIGEQFHWQNNDYIDFNDFLTSLSSRKRKSINKERKYIKNCNIQILKKIIFFH